MRGTGRSMRAAMVTMVTMGALGLLAPWSGDGVAAQQEQALPFTVGERLTYRVKMEKMGASGRGVMTVEESADVRGTPVYLLRFDLEAGVGPIKGADHTRSWLDPERMASVRFAKRERRPMVKRERQVEFYAERRRWEASGGKSGDSPTNRPLDELSFIYFVRTLPLVEDTTYRFDRHFQMDRNPITVRVLGRETVTTPAGEFQTRLVEMRVRDPEHYRGEGILRFSLTEDAARVPVRIESVMPDAGRVVLTLESKVCPGFRLAEE
jgi:hypothetical protein